MMKKKYKIGTHYAYYDGEKLLAVIKVIELLETYPYARGMCLCSFNDRNWTKNREYGIAHTKSIELRDFKEFKCKKISKQNLMVEIL